jgi:hypothetical protein
VAAEQGFKTSLRAGEEPSYGVMPGTVNAWKFPVVRPGLKLTQNLISSRALLDDANPRKPASGNKAADGSTEMEVGARSIGWWLKWLLGTVTSTAAGTGAGYLINNGAGYPAGTTTLTLDTGTGTIPVNTWVKIGTKVYRVNSSTGSPVTSITIDGGLIAAVLDNATVTIPAASVGHKFTLGSTAPTSIFVEHGFGTTSRFHLYNGVYVDRMSFRLTPEGLMAVGIDLTGKGALTLAGTTAITGTLTSPAHNTFSYFGGSIWQGTNLLGIVKSMDFVISRERDKSQYVITDPGGMRGSIPSGIAMIEGTLKVLFEDDALTQLGLDGTETSLRATLRSQDADEAFDIAFPEARLAPSTPEVVSEAVVEQDVPFKAYFGDGAEGTSSVLTLLNTVTSYASM